MPNHACSLMILHWGGVSCCPGPSHTILTPVLQLFGRPSCLVRILTNHRWSGHAGLPVQTFQAGSHACLPHYHTLVERLSRLSYVLVLPLTRKANSGLSGSCAELRILFGLGTNQPNPVCLCITSITSKQDTLIVQRPSVFIKHIDNKHGRNTNEEKKSENERQILNYLST